MPTPTPPSSTFSSTVRPGKRRTDWKVRARPRRASRCGLSPVTSWPFIRTVPAVGFWKPRERVDERRLAGAVRADQAEDLALPQDEVDAVDRVDAPEVNLEAARLEQLRAVRDGGLGLGSGTRSLHQDPNALYHGY